MIKLFSKLFSSAPPVDFKQLVKDGAQIIDVRSRGEYNGGHIRGSVNIPLDTLESSLRSIKKDKPVITCCASGMRSASAKRILQSAGYGNVHNGGGWSSLQAELG